MPASSSIEDAVRIATRRSWSVFNGNHRERYLLTICEIAEVEFPFTTLIPPLPHSLRWKMYSGAKKKGSEDSLCPSFPEVALRTLFHGNAGTWIPKHLLPRSRLYSCSASANLSSGNLLRSIRQNDTQHAPTQLKTLLKTLLEFPSLLLYLEAPSLCCSRAKKKEGD